MTTMTDIRDQLIEIFNGIRDGSIDPKDAIELNNTAGKIINSARVQIAYHAMRGETPRIAFLESTENTKRIEGGNEEKGRSIAKGA